MKSKNIKVVEIRDRSTLIPAFAIMILPSDEMEFFLFKDAGYGFIYPCVLLISIQAPWHSARHWDEWGERSPRTMTVAHKYIEEHFESLLSGQVIDVEFILGEKEKPSINSFIEEKAEILKQLAENEIELQDDNEQIKS